MNFSNKNLAVVLVVAIVVSLGGTIISLNKLNELTAPHQFTTGRATTGAGQVNVTIVSSAACTVDTSINFTTGSPTQSRTLSSDGNNNFDGFTCDAQTPGTGNCWGLQINNTGNVKLNISYNSSKNGSGLLGAGHTEADFMWTADDTEIEPDSCAIEPSDWKQVSTEAASNNSNVCANLNYTDESDVIIMDFNVTVNQNTAPSATPKTATINIGCVDST